MRLRQRVLCAALIVSFARGADALAADRQTEPRASAVTTVSSPLICGEPVAPTTSITASDALLVLRAAVGSDQCHLCVCDTDHSLQVTASDALLTLKKAVGHEVTLDCPPCCNQCEGDCTAGVLTLTLESISPCEGCIPRVPPSNVVPDSASITFDDVMNGTHELSYVAPCMWQKTLPGAVVEKIIYGSGVTDCTGSFQVFEGGDVILRVDRSATGWEIYVGQYPAELTWGDALRATIDAPTCADGGNAVSENATCVLADISDLDTYDVQATGGSATLEVPAACP